MRVILLHGAPGIVAEYFLPIKDMNGGDQDGVAMLSRRNAENRAAGRLPSSHLYVLFIWDKALMPSAHSQEPPSPYGAE